MAWPSSSAGKGAVFGFQANFGDFLEEFGQKTRNFGFFKKIFQLKDSFLYFYGP